MVNTKEVREMCHFAHFGGGRSTAVAKEPTSFEIRVILMTRRCIHIHVETRMTVTEWKLAVHIWPGCIDHDQRGHYNRSFTSV